MHTDKLGIILDSGKGALDIVVAGVTVVVGIGYGKVPLPDAEPMKGGGKVQFGLVFLVGPVVYSECAGKWTETAVG